MARKPQMTEEQLAYAAEALRKGRRTKAELAVEFGVTPPAVSAALKRREAKLSAGALSETFDPVRPTPPAIETLPADIAPPAGMSAEDQRGWFTRKSEEYSRRASELFAIDETVEARKCDEMAIKAQLALLRINKGDDADVIRISKDDLKDRADRVRDNAKKLMAERGLLCAHCSKQLSIKWGKGE